MLFQSATDEKILVASVVTQQQYLFDQNLDAGMTILWNTGPTAHFVFDNQKINVEKNCITFLTEFHKVKTLVFDELNVIQFNRDFYCVEKHDHETGCKGILFYSTTDIPKLIIPKEKQKQFTALWDVFLLEMEEKDLLKIDMLRALLKRFLIICLRIYKTQSNNIPADDSSIAIVREFNYLVEVHFRELTQVKEYAILLHKSPKTIANTFKKFIDKTPLQLINERRMREARHLLKYTEWSIQEIATELNFADPQAFSHFFKKRSKQSPSNYRNALAQ